MSRRSMQIQPVGVLSLSADSTSGEGGGGGGGGGEGGRGGKGGGGCCVAPCIPRNILHETYTVTLCRHVCHVRRVFYCAAGGFY